MTGAPEWLEGTVDFHVHSEPSLFPRRFDDLELVTHFVDAGMAGIVLKAHEGSTAERAFLARRASEERAIAIHGGIVLNRFVGGFNAHAVEAALALGGRVVWMPTLHAKNHVDFYGDAQFKEQRARARARAGAGAGAGAGRDSGRLELQPLTAIDDEGRLTSDVQNVLDVLAAEPSAVLSNGHLSGPETLALFREARARGVEKLLVAHPELPLSGFDLALQRELAELGAIIEHTYLPHLPRWGGLAMDVTAGNIRGVGVARCILSSDLGQSTSPPPAEGLAAFGLELMKRGLSERELRRMLVETPSILLES